MFETWFRTVHPYNPFPWQTATAERLLTGEPFDAVDIPTGGGKTALIDIWLWALAQQASLPADERTVPLRLVWAVDRRVVVDQAWATATSLADLLSSGELADTAEALRSYTGHDPLLPPLAVERVRGGVTVPDLWRLRPDQPAVICGTVAHLGSRLLGRGYGTSTWMRSVEQGLLGHDCLIVVDEADIAEPLVDLVDRVAAMWPHKRAARVIACSATLSTERAAVVRPTAADEADEMFGDRWSTPKPVNLHPLPKGSDDVDVRRLMAELALAADGKVLVVANTAGGARHIHSMISRSHPGALLITGRQRDHDAQSVTTRVLSVLGNHCSAITFVTPVMRDGKATSGPASDSHCSVLPMPGRAPLIPITSGDMPDSHCRCNGGGEFEPLKPTIVIATQTIEIGADLDADVLVTECPDSRSLQQRCGRAGRAGGGAEIHVVPPTSASRFVYDDAAKECWAWLSDAKVADLSPKAWSVLRAGGGVPAPVERPDAVPVSRPVMEALARTCAAGGDPTPYLAPMEQDLDVGVVWRDGLTDVIAAVYDLGFGDQTVADWASPVEAPEICEVPVWDVARWVEQLPAGTWIRVRDGEVTDGVLRVGDVVIVDSTVGGLDQWGWAPLNDAPVTDVSASRVRVGGRAWVDLWDEHGGMPPVDLIAPLVGLPVGAFTVTVGTTAGCVVQPVATLDPTEDERSQRSGPVTLEDHQLDVADLAEAIAGRLDADMVALRAAGLHHDCGKGGRFQVFLGFELGCGPLMAKSATSTPGDYQSRCRASGWPIGGRHELASVRMADLNGLARHLVVTHHGRNRGAGIPTADPVGVDAADWVGGLDQHTIDDWGHLLDEHGPWRLGWLEAILRASDHYASAHPVRGRR